ncbi:hypothetical protein [Limosilactobacillus reuteri]|uniref:hypothetical protein n=1 Tax=Limosilactobacillus reuteri TaxID=1598 RepID=UPI001CDD3B08|nr:hypothetical protein [Limosilactobacillus reuteri]MCH5385952.1 hypothetical protein [Limosilactobacillus reuteri]
MTKDKVKAKWAVAKRMAEITQAEYSSHTVNAKAIKFVKTKLQIAIYYLSQLDEHDSNYTMPFTGKQIRHRLQSKTLKMQLIGATSAV